MALSMKQNQQQRQKLTQEQSFFLDMLKFNKEELMDYLEYQENPLIDFDRRAFNKEGSSFEDNLLNVENNQAKETLQEHLLQQTGFFTGNVPGTIAEFLIYSVDHNGYLQEESIAEVHFSAIYERAGRRIYSMYAADGTDWCVCQKSAGMYGSPVARVRFSLQKRMYTDCRKTYPVAGRKQVA